MTFSFHTEAEEKFNNAIDYYEEAEPGQRLTKKSADRWFNDFAAEYYTPKRETQFLSLQ